MSKENSEIFDDGFDIFSDVADSLEAKQSAIEVNQVQENDNTDEIDNYINISNDDNTEEESVEETNVEEVVEETEETNDIEESEDATSEETQTSPFTPYAKFLIEEGILSNLNLDEFDGTAEALKKAQANEINNGIEAYKNSLPREVKFLVDNYEAGVPFDKILEISSRQIEYQSIEESSITDNEDLQKNLVKDYLKRTTRFSDEKIEKHINQLADLSELEDEARDALSNLVDFEKQELEAAKEKAIADQNAAIEMQKKEIERLDKYLDETEEIIPNIKIPKVIKDKIKANLTTPVAQDEYGNQFNKVGLYRANNPMQFEVVLNYLFEVTNEFKDWSALGKAGKRSALKELEDAAKTIDSRQASSSSSGQRITSKEGSKGLLDAIKGFEF